MAKSKVGIWLDGEIAERLDLMAEQFDGLKGELVSAALSMFFNASVDQQRAALKDVMGAKVDRLFAEPKGFKLQQAAKKSGPK